MHTRSKVITMKNKRSKTVSAPDSSIQIVKNGKKRLIILNGEIEIELEDGLFLMMRRKHLYDLWRTTEFPIKFYDDDAQYIVENWTDWFNLPKDFNDALFEVYFNHVDRNKFILQAYKE